MPALIAFVRAMFGSAHDLKGILVALGIAILIGVAIYVHEKSEIK